MRTGLKGCRRELALFNGAKLTANPGHGNAPEGTVVRNGLQQSRGFVW